MKGLTRASILLIIISLLGLSFWQNKQVRVLKQQSRQLGEVNNWLIARSVFQSDLIDASIADSITVTGVDRKSMRLGHYLNGTKLILRISSSMCETCVQQEMQNLMGFSKVIDPTDILIITSHPSARDLILLKRKYNIPFNIYNLDSLGLLSLHQISDLNKPYYLVTEGGQLVNVFVPEVSIPELSVQYFRHVYSFFRED